MRKRVTPFLLLLIAACSSRPVPSDILLPQQMKKVVLDLIKIDEFVNTFVVKDSTIDIKKKRSILYEQVFKLNNTSRKEFYSSYKYYQQHSDLQKGLFDSLYEDLNRKSPEAGRPKPGKVSP